MPIPGLSRVQRAVDCECGVAIEAANDDELLDELFQHIAAAHDGALRLDPLEMLIDAYEA